MLEQLPAGLLEGLAGTVADQWPDSLDLLELAEAENGNYLEAAQVQPVYLRNEIHWKKLSEQG